MSSSQFLLQAVLQRLGVRLGSGLVEAAASVSGLAQDAPDRLRQEIQLFWEEVEAEAQRLESGAEPGATADRPGSGPETSTPINTPFISEPLAGGFGSVDPQDLIDGLRAQVAAIARHLDQAK